MSGSLIIVLIIVVWLFVLAPLLLRGQKPIRKAGEAFDDTRVLYEGGSGRLLGSIRRRPKLPQVSEHTGESSEDYEEVPAEDVLLDDARPSRPFLGMFTRRDSADEEPGIIDGAVVHELEAVPDSVEEPVEEDEFYYDEDDTTYAYDDSYTAPADLMYPDDTVVEVLDEEPVDEDAEFEVGAEENDLTDEEIEFAESRRGRGGYDPVADAEHSTTRYQRRQRTLIGLIAAVVVTLVLGFFLGGWAWALPSAAALVTAVYLVALRTQTRQEEALRRRRIQQLRRARLGVRNVADEELSIPRNLRRPGAVVLELDDESPDFEYLPVAEAHFEEDIDVTPARRRPFRRVG
ncbi:hypothetical protein CATRI_03660 [Corynebacterium atrinae]|uniref:divisome protein SepX/GlpR n=1 Tax=Corynebacterium atrinae TaxID=1336740 RepID=UPI0025B48105|nr:gephyrin-like molybdotransferase receptor GlpR [Corynebacterium atrinae]WJY62830.1 hypothetical protein CATRI_03660 [Corynebacterium atrinae]